MDLLDAAAVLAAFAGPVVLVLVDVVAYDRPRAEPEVAVPVEAAAMTVSPVLGVGRIPQAEAVEVAAAVPEPVAAPAPEPAAAREPASAHESMLADLTATELDERSALRRVASLLVLLTFTAGAAAAVAAAIYKGVSALG